MDKAFDAIVAGGGPAGVLAAVRLAAALPGRRIVLLEREPLLGGRLRASSPAHRVHSYGLNAVSAALFEFWGQTLKGTGPAASDLAELVARRQLRMGVLAGNRIAQTAIEDWFTAKGARTLGGLSASRAWGDVTAIVGSGGASAAAPDQAAAASKGRGSRQRPAAATIAAAEGEADAGAAGEDDGEGEDDEGRSAHAFAHFWKTPRKVPAAVVLEHFAAAFGIPDVWSAAPAALAQRAAFYAGRLHAGDWHAALTALLAGAGAGVVVVTGNRIVDATLTDDGWEVAAEKGRYRAPALVVAQPPWQAAGWLKRGLWPAHLLQVVSKTKPVSVVVLGETLTDPAIDLPDVTLVPAERVQIIRNGALELSFQATIDYELSLQAPAVVKAVKALKRARKKLSAVYPGVVSEAGHIALQPVAWAQSPAHSDRRYLERLGRKNFQSERLAFCGDAYGASYDGDLNLIRSLLSACETVAAALAKRPAATAPPAPSEAAPGEGATGLVPESSAESAPVAEVGLPVATPPVIEAGAADAPGAGSDAAAEAEAELAALAAELAALEAQELAEAADRAGAQAADPAEAAPHEPARLPSGSPDPGPAGPQPEP